VIQELVQQELLQQSVQQSGFAVSDEQLAETIRSIPSFQQNGQFSAELYNRLLEQQRRSKAAFEGQIRQAMRLEQFDTGVIATTTVSPSQINDFVSLRDQLRSFRYVVFAKDKYGSQVSLDDEAIKTFYETNSSQFMTPEQVQIEYVLLDEKELLQQVSIDEASLQALYEQEKERFKSPQSRKVRHILLKIAEAASAENIAAIEEKGRALSEKIRQGEDFAAIARDNSDDSLTVEQGGVLGEIHLGDMAPALEKVIFALQPGEVSNPVRTPLGFQIVQVDEIIGGEVLSFEAARAELEKEYRHRQMESKLLDYSEKLLTLTYEDPNSLTAAADAIGSKVKVSDWFSRAGGKDELTRNSKVVQAAFSDMVLRQAHNSEVIALDDGRQLVLRLREHKPAEVLPLEEVKEQIRSQLLDREARNLAQQQAAAMVNALNDGGDFDSLASQSGMEILAREKANRQTADLAPAMLQQVFRMVRPEGGKAVYSAVSLSNGDQAVISLESVTTPDTAADIQQQALLQNLRQQYAQRELESAYQAMQSRAKIDVFRQNLESSP
jgi:peptidyl-prolyl cis-trans isomerase D